MDCWNEDIKHLLHKLLFHWEEIALNIKTGKNDEVPLCRSRWPWRRGLRPSRPAHLRAGRPDWTIVSEGIDLKVWRALPRSLAPPLNPEALLSVVKPSIKLPRQPSVHHSHPSCKGDGQSDARQRASPWLSGEITRLRGEGGRWNEKIFALMEKRRKKRIAICNI